MSESTGLMTHRMATDAASVCKAVVLQTAISLQGKRYVRVEGWQAIANAFGCVASSTDVERVEGGIRATGQVRRMSDGAIIATAEGFVGDDEAKTWGKRPEFARRAMAQTRAIARACKSAFAFVVCLMDCGLETTPAEEMDGVFERPVVRKEMRGLPSPGSAISDPAAKARLAINRSRTLDELDKVRRGLDVRRNEGVFDAQTHAELVALTLGQAERLGIDGIKEFAGEEIEQDPVEARA